MEKVITGLNPAIVTIKSGFNSTAPGEEPISAAIALRRRFSRPGAWNAPKLQFKLQLLQNVKINVDLWAER